MNRCPRAVSARIYIHSCFLFDSPAATVETTKHRSRLAQIVFPSSPLSTEPKGQPAKVTPRTRHTGDAGGDVASLGRQC